MDFVEKIDNSWKRTTNINTLQVNLGKRCNLSCTHCHVNAGPARKEIMSKDNVDDVIAVLNKFDFRVLDLTGGEPAMHPQFRYLIEHANNHVEKIIVRTNLVILGEEGYEDYIDFYVKNKVQLVASLPCYTKENTDSMRGEGTFTACVAVLEKLNKAGYGADDSLELNLVYNPGGAFLPGSQTDLQNDYKRVLGESYDLKFNHLFTITNLPIGRFAQELKRENLVEEYFKLLEENFNEEAARNVMCRSQISVGWDGQLYDCDFNQMLDMRANGPATLKKLLSEDSLGRQIVFANHCFGCTAGAGSSCGGAIA
jgi:radical SAM/Cys-rich protein